MISGDIKVIVIDDHPVVLEGLASGLEQYPGITITGSAMDMPQAVRLIEKSAFDLMIVDLNMPSAEDGLKLVRLAVSRSPRSKIIVLSYSNDPEDIYRANQAGAHAYLLKDSDLDAISSAISTVCSGGRPPLDPSIEAALWSRLRERPSELPCGLSPREWKVLNFLIQGATNAEIARELFVSPRLVRMENTSIYRKLAVRNRAEAVARALREGWFK